MADLRLRRALLVEEFVVLDGLLVVRVADRADDEAVDLEQFVDDLDDELRRLLAEFRQLLGAAAEAAAIAAAAADALREDPDRAGPAQFDTRARTVGHRDDVPLAAAASAAAHRQLAAERALAAREIAGAVAAATADALGKDAK
ncbi:hypothetical protein [Bosea rubneri]|uniref:HPt domain-containing protein n=1 Tax=Bosea rubneri TaxID=3075434 RepID=A0ABU3SDU9_9HYPH|nr:hypothetical protein [Bosea sp. ZW T0_25]MDU0342932.1 hypothetical protein [Bosea sp. ZW T0_25]